MDEQSGESEEKVVMGEEIVTYSFTHQWMNKGVDSRDKVNKHYIYTSVEQQTVNYDTFLHEDQDGDAKFKHSSRYHCGRVYAGSRPPSVIIIISK